jgi:hypothetical protein
VCPEGSEIHITNPAILRVTTPEFRRPSRRHLTLGSQCTMCGRVFPLSLRFPGSNRHKLYSQPRCSKCRKVKAAKPGAQQPLFV